MPQIDPIRPPVLPDPPSPGAMPTASTGAGGVAGAAAALIIMFLGQKGITFPAGAEALLAVVVSFIASYLPSSGRK